MKGPLRKTMTWLHTWSGLIMGWLLFAVFVTGTLSFFRAEITHWMQPETHVSAAPANAAQIAYDVLQEQAPFAKSWQITLPEGRSNLTSLRWEMPNEKVERRRGPRATIDAATGESIEPRETAGGNFLYRFHYRLHNLDRDIGQSTVGIAAMAMLIAIISGVIMHRKIFTDFFSFRTKKRAVGWLDAHAIVAVLALPFHFLITFTGLMLVAGSLLFWMEDGRGGGGPSQQNNVRNSEQAQVAGERTGNTRGNNGATGGIAREGGNRGSGISRDENSGETIARGETMPRGETMARGETIARGERRGLGKPMTRNGGINRPNQAVTVPLRDMINKAELELGDAVGSITISNPMRSTAEYQLNSAFADKVTGGRRSRTLVYFDGNGDFIKTETNARNATVTSSINSTLRTLHEARFANYFTRWLLFIAGIMGCVMVASGSILWTIKRAKSQLGLFGYELVCGLNVGCITGFCCAVACYFWANRLIPATAMDRDTLEITVFFYAWLIMGIHGLVFRHKLGWLMQLAIASALFLTLPILDSLTSTVSLVSAVVLQDWQRLSFDLISMTIGTLLLMAFMLTLKATPVKSKSRKKKVNSSMEGLKAEV